MKSSYQREFPSLKSGRGQTVSTQEQETLQLEIANTNHGLDQGHISPLFLHSMTKDDYQYYTYYKYTNHLYLGLETTGIELTATREESACCPFD